MEEHRTFAEWLTNFILMHPKINIAISQGSYGCLEISMTKETLSGRKKRCGYLSTIDIFSQTETNLDDALIYICEKLVKEIEPMDELGYKEVRFDKWCKKCKHYAHKFPKEKFSFEAQDPCNTCLSHGMRRGTEKPEYWEAK